MKKFKYEIAIGMVIKKHYCPKCSNLVTVKKIKKIVNSKSEEAKNFDFTSDVGGMRGYLKGDVEFIWYVYYCSNCDIEITNKEMRKYERAKKGKKEIKPRNKKRNIIEFILFIILALVLQMIFRNICSKAEANNTILQFEPVDSTMGIMDS